MVRENTPVVEKDDDISTGQTKDSQVTKFNTMQPIVEEQKQLKRIQVYQSKLMCNKNSTQKLLEKHQ